jgi:phenylacetate-CoA ligase
LVEHGIQSREHETPYPIDRLRDQRVRAMVRYCYERSPYYRRRLDELGVAADEIRGVDDLGQLPILLSKEDERELQERSRSELGHPFGEHLCAAVDEVVSVCSTSGSTGTPTFYAFTADDIAITDELWQRALRLATVGRGDICVHAFGLSMYLAGVPLVRAIERMGAQAVPVGAEVGSEKLLRIGALVGASVLCCTPSYAGYLIEQAPEQMRALGLRRIVCAGEPGAGLVEVRAQIEEATGAIVHDALGGAHGIMNASDGAHPYAGMTVLADDCSVQQLVDQETGAPVAIPDDGRPAYGERVKTTLRWRAQPQLRGAVGDVYEMRRVPGPDGGLETRVRVIGRTDDMLIVKGVKLYPAAVRDIVAELSPRTTGQFRIVLEGPPPRVQPPLRLRVERGEGSSADSDDALVSALSERMHARLAVRPMIDVLPAGALARTAHKATMIEMAGERGQNDD